MLIKVRNRIKIRNRYIKHHTCLEKRMQQILAKQIAAITFKAMSKAQRLNFTYLGHGKTFLVRILQKYQYQMQV